LQHPNIVGVYEVGFEGDVPFFSMELVEGGSLHAKLAGQPQPPGQAALVETLARAVDYAHLHGVVHRDLKPGNVLLTADNVPKVADFGLVRLEQETPADASGEANTQQRAPAGRNGLTVSGAIVGTPSYMAPEQAQGKNREVGPPADVYALGAVLYECLTGRPPFRSDSPLDTLVQVLTEEPVPPTRLNPKVPRDLETICLMCLYKHPARRYPCAADLADDLGRFQRKEPIRARPVGVLERGWRWAR
jgi:serine/threonine protein kinase